MPKIETWKWRNNLESFQIRGMNIILKLYHEWKYKMTFEAKIFNENNEMSVKIDISR